MKSSSPGRSTKRQKTTKADPITQYALDVVEGRIVAGRLVKGACQRHLNDLQIAEQRGWVWRPDVGMRPADFAATFCVHSKGEWGREKQPVEFEPWEIFIVGTIFGWLEHYEKKDKRGKVTRGLRRRFRKVFIAISRKNGKTLLAAVLGLYLMIADGEAGAEIYAAATKEKQAMLAWKDASTMVRKSPDLAEIIQRRRKRLFVETDEMEAEFVPLGKDSDKHDGLNPSGALVDEIHAHKDSSMWDVLSSGMGARLEPLLIGITTAGFDTEGFGHQEWEYVTRILEGTAENNAYFGIIYALDEDDDPFDEANWIKANPNLGVSVNLDFLRDQAREAKQAPHKLASFLVKHLNRWLGKGTSWMPLNKWDASAKLTARLRLEDYRGRQAIVGMDMSSSIDLAAVVVVILPTQEDPQYTIIPFFWMPADGLKERAEQDRVPYDRWVEQGLITACEGEVIDHRDMEKFVQDLPGKVNVVEVCYDPYNALSVVANLIEAGLPMVEIRQKWNLSPGMKELGVLVYRRMVEHGRHPVLRWMLGNTVAKIDDNENIRPIKPKDRTRRIDGIAATITAWARVIVHRPWSPEPATSEAEGRKVKVW